MEQGSPDRAIAFLQELNLELRRIGSNPRHYQLRPDIGVDARLSVVGRHVVLFRIRDERNLVRVERIVYGRRDLPGLYRR
jgi:toxin ParE1/3/4